MSTRKAQQLQICEPVPGLKILVQLSNTPLVRIIIATITRHQLAIIGVVFVATLVFSMRENAPWLTVPKQVAIEFFSAVSQSLAALLGVLIVFLTFTSQLIAQRRYEDYYTLQIQIDQLIALQSHPRDESFHSRNCQVILSVGSFSRVFAVIWHYRFAKEVSRSQPTCNCLSSNLGIDCALRAST